MSVHCCMDKQNGCIHTMEHYSATKKNEWLIHAIIWVNLKNIIAGEETSHRRPHTVWCCVWETQNRQIHRDGRCTSGCPGLERRGMGSDSPWVWFLYFLTFLFIFFFLRWWNVLKVARGDDCTTLNRSQTTELFTWMGEFMVWILCHTVVLKSKTNSWPYRWQNINIVSFTLLVIWSHMSWHCGGKKEWVSP